MSKVLALRDNEILEFSALHTLVTGCPVGRYDSTPNASISAFRKLTQADPDLAARCVIWASQHSTARPHLMQGLEFLGRSHYPLFREVLFRSVQSADDLLWMYSRVVRRGNKMIREIAAQWLELFLTERDVLLLRKKRARHKLSLRDLTILTHPTFHGERMAHMDFLFGRTPRDPGPLLTSYLRARSADPGKLGEILEDVPLPWQIASSWVGSDPDLWESAAWGMTFEEFMSFLPAQNRQAAFVEGTPRFELLKELTSRQRKPNPVPFIRMLRRLEAPRDRDLIELLLQRAVNAAAQIEQVRSTFRAVDRSAGSSGEFLDLSIASMAWSFGTLALYDDRLEKVEFPPQALKRVLLDARPRGGWNPEWIVSRAGEDTAPVENLLLSSSRLIPDSHQFWRMTEWYRENRAPLAVVCIVLPEGVREERRYADGYLVRRVESPERLPDYLPLLGDPARLMDGISRLPLTIVGGSR